MKITRLLIKFISLIIILASLYFLITKLYTETVNLVAAYLLIFCSFYLVYNYRKDTKLFITYFFIFYVNYSISINRYIHVSLDGFLNQINDTITKGEGIFILLFFISILILLSKECDTVINDTTKNHFVIEKGCNCIIGVVVILILITIFIGSAYYKVFSGQLYEYSIIFFIIGFYFSGRNIKIRLSMVAIMFIYAFNTFYNGKRVSVLQIIVVYFIMFHSYKISYKKTIPYIIGGVIFLTFISIYREGLGKFSILDVFIILKNRMFAMDTAYYAYYTSLTFLKVKGIIDINEQFRLLRNFILSMFAGSRVVDSNLANYTKSFYFHYDGGILPYFFYFWLGWLGLPLAAIIVSIYTNISSKIKLSSSGFKKCLATYFCSIVFRWYLYSPTGLIRGVLLLLIVYLGFFYADYIMERIVTNNKVFSTKNKDM